MSSSTPVATSEVMFQRPKDVLEQIRTEVLVVQARKLGLPPAHDRDDGRERV